MPVNRLKNKLSSLAFRHRRYISSGALLLGTIIKAFVQGRSVRTAWLVGIGLVLLALALRIYAAAYLRGRHVVTEIEAESLCIAGPFAYVRNPLYIGNFIIGLAVALTLNEWYCYLIFGAEFTLMYALIIPYEEQFLSRKFTADYSAYCSEIHRFLPSLRPYPETHAVTPNYRSALVGEAPHVLILLLAFTLFYYLFIA